MKVSLDIHDYSEHRLGFVWINKLRELYPDIKLSMFYIPIDQEYYGNYSDLDRREARKLIKTAVNEGIMEIIPHGLTHRFGEFKTASYEDMALTLRAYEEHFKELDLPYVHGFCAPNWLISQEAIGCLDDNGWWLAGDRNQPDALKAKKNYIYNWSIDENMPKTDILMGHSHINSCKNELAGNIKNIIKIPANAKWVFVSDLMKNV
jgi:hypothetical protein